MTIDKFTGVDESSNNAICQFKTLNTLRPYQGNRNQLHRAFRRPDLSQRMLAFSKFGLRVVTVSAIGVLQSFRRRESPNMTPFQQKFARLKSGLLLITLLCLWMAGCATIRVNNLADRLAPSNDRDWTRDMLLVTTADVGPDTITIHNIRHCTYVTERDYTVDYSDRTIPLEDIRSVDFIVVPFSNMPAIAHTMLSFEMADGSYLSVSVEIRKERGEEYTPMLGISNQFELIYVVADERDLIRLRTRYRNAQVYIYPTMATAAQAQQLFVDICKRINQLAAKPEFYHTFGNNCTTNIVKHVNDLSENRVPFTWKVLLPGYSDQYAYDLGLLDNRVPFAELKSIALINDLADEHFDEPDFSRRIRSRRMQLEIED